MSFRKVCDVAALLMSANVFPSQILKRESTVFQLYNQYCKLQLSEL